MDRSATVEPLVIASHGTNSAGSGRLGFRELCHGTQFDEFRDSLNTVFYPARVEAAGRDVRLLPGSQLSTANMRYLTLGLVCFGTETRVDPGALGSYHVNVPLSGTVESHCGPRRMVATPGHAAVFTPREHTYLPHWGADASQLCIKISRPAVEEELEGLLGRPVDSWVRFDLDFDLTRGPGRSWLAGLRLLLSELNDPDSLVHQSEHYRERLERMVVSGLVLAHHHDYAERLAAPQPPARPRTIKRVLDAIDAAPEEDWSLADMARLAGVCARRVQQGFQEHLGMTPTAYLRRIRLERSRGDLAAGAPSVADVAYRWGFTNLGRFARAYRDQFGETPSETLRRVRY